MNGQILHKPLFEFHCLSHVGFSHSWLVALISAVPPLSYNYGFLGMINAEMHPNI